MDNFEKLIKEKVEQFDVPYNPDHWTEFESKLSASESKINTQKIIKGAAVAIGIAVLSSAAYLLYNNPNPKTNKTPEITANNTTQATNNINSENIVDNTTITSPSNKVINNSTDNTNQNNISHESDQLEESIVIDETTTNSGLNENTSSNNNTSVANNTFGDFIVYNNVVCVGEEVSFEPTNVNNFYSYEWNFGDGSTSNSIKPKHIYKDAGNFKIELTVTDNKTNTSKTITHNNIVRINPLPQVNFSVVDEAKNNENNRLKHPYVSIKAKNINRDYVYNWQIGNKIKSSNPIEKILIKNKGTYDIQLTITDNNSCSASKTKNLIIEKDFDLLAQNSFMPFGSVAINKTFIPLTLKEYDIRFKMVIKDLSGKVVFETEDYNNPWNGKYQNTGNMLPEGYYGWQIITYDAQNNPHLHTGKINLLY